MKGENAYYRDMLLSGKRLLTSHLRKRATAEIHIDTLKVTMPQKNWYYQVWVHYRQEPSVTLMETFKDKMRALSYACKRNLADKHDARGGMPRRYFYVKPVTEEQMIEMKKERHRRHSEEWKSFKCHFHKKLLPVCREIITAVVFAIETCEVQHFERLRKHGGYLDCYKGTIDEVGMTTCSLLFSINNIILELTLINGDEIDSIAVESFEQIWVLRSWLLGIQGAAAACENRLIEMLYDRHRLNDTKN